MLTKITIRNFKRFGDVEIDLGDPVVFIGPNNSGKTTALQALSLWQLGVKKWVERRGEISSKKKQGIGVTINRKDVFVSPVLRSNLLWKNLHCRETYLEAGKRKTKNIRIELMVEGVTNSKKWKVGMEFDYLNEESFVVRPIKDESVSTKTGKTEAISLPAEAQNAKISFLPPMSGLATQEFRKERGEIDVLIGEGRTAEVLRNLCYQVYSANPFRWTQISKKIESFFGVALEEPEYFTERSELIMGYREFKKGPILDISLAGRGLQQTLLLLTYLEVNPGSVILLDEPDAHLEILRQRQIYQMLSESSKEQKSQIVAASHSEVILREAVGRDVVVAFLGKPHRIDQGTQLIKSLKDIDFEDYYQALQTGFAFYFEGPTDLAILQAFAEKLNHRALEYLEKPFVHYVFNQPKKAEEHFFGIRECKSDLVGFALFDRLDRGGLPNSPGLTHHVWARKEIENYFCFPDVLLKYAEDFFDEQSPGPLFNQPDLRKKTMQECIEDFVPRAALRNLSDKWWTETKASTDFLDRLFELYYQKLGLPNLMRKNGYYGLVKYIDKSQVPDEVKVVLEEILKIGKKSRPTQE